MKKTFTILATVFITTTIFAQVPSYVPTSGLVGWFPFTGNANDQSASLNNGTVSGAILAPDRYTNPNCAYNFDGISNYIDIGNSTSLNFTNAISVSSWIKISNLGSNMKIIEQEDAVNFWANYQFYISSAGQVGVGLRINTTTTAYTLSTNVLNTGQWHHIAFTWGRTINSGMCKIYIDGVEVTYSTQNPLTTNLFVITPENTKIGADIHAPFNAFDGEIDDIGIWNLALSLSEISDLYNSGMALNPCLPSYVPTSGLVGWYPFCGNANDESGNGNNGTVNGASLFADRFGNPNSAYSFNGANSNISIPHSSSLIFGSNAITISFWAKINSVNSQGFNNIMISKQAGSGGSQQGFNVGENTNQAVSLLVSNGGGNFGSADIPSIALNQYYYFVYIYDNGTGTSYLNGVLIANTTGQTATIGANTMDLLFGQANWSNINAINYDGILDDIGIWNRALTSTEVTSVFNGCSNPPAFITSQGNTTFCQGGFVILNASTATGNTYQWYTGGILIGSATASTYTATQSGNYTVVVSNNGCSTTSTPVTVTVNAAPSGAVSVSGPTTFCSGNSVTLTAQGTGTYLWSNNATTNSITVTQSGAYSVTLTSNGCSATSAVTNVTVNQTPTATITPQGSTTFCQGGSVVLTANGGGTYQWSTSATSSNITVNQSNTYSVIVSNNGCSATASQVVTVNPNPTVSLTPLGNFTNYYTNPITLNGIPNGGTYIGIGVTGNTFNPNTAGLGSHTINYIYTNGAGCSGNATQSTIVYDTLGSVCTTYDTITTLISVTDTLIINALLTGVAPPNNVNTIKVYPNPSSDHIYIDNGNYSSMTGYSCTITNTFSQQVFYALINQQQFYIDILTWTGNGLYFLTIRDASNGIIEVKKIIIQ